MDRSRQEAVASVARALAVGVAPHLRRLVIKPFDEQWPGGFMTGLSTVTWSGLAQALEARAGGTPSCRGLEVLQLAAPWQPHALDRRHDRRADPLPRLLASPSCSSTLTELHLGPHLPQALLDSLGHGLRLHKLPALKVLAIGSGAVPYPPFLAQFRPVGLELTRALGEGAAPALQCLRLVAVDLRGQAALHLALAIERGALKELQELELPYCFLQPGDWAWVFQAASPLRSHGFPRLRVISLDHVLGLKEEAGPTALAHCMAEGGFPRLEALDLGSYGRHRENIDALQAVATALASAAPCTRSLSKLTVNVGGNDGVRILTSALARSPCPQLTDVYLGYNTAVDAEGAEMLARALEDGALPRLRKLCVGARDHLGSKGVGALMQAFRSGACPFLEELTLWGKFGQRGASIIAEAMRVGGLRNLRRLTVNCSAVGLAGQRALEEALATGCCPFLTRERMDVTVVLDGKRRETGCDCYRRSW